MPAQQNPCRCEGLLRSRAQYPFGKVCYSSGADTHQLLTAEHQLDIIISSPDLHWSTIRAFGICFDAKVSQLSKSSDSWSMSAEVTASICLCCPLFKGYLLAPTRVNRTSATLPRTSRSHPSVPWLLLQVAEYKNICCWYNQDLRVTDPAAVPKCTHTGWVHLNSPSSCRAGLNPLLQVKYCNSPGQQIFSATPMHAKHHASDSLHAQHGLSDCRRH